jgi:DNA repair protein RadD
MSITLRDYQVDALLAIKRALTLKDNCLLQAPTGAGKTIIFANLIGLWIREFPKLRVMVLAHRQELVDQAFSKLVGEYPDLYLKTRRACAGLGKVELNQPITIGTYQTLVRREITKEIHLVIIDEAHRITPKNQKSSYKTLIENLRAINPETRILGVTATPWRLGSGYIFGGENDWFDVLDYSIDMKRLIDQGYLVPIRFKVSVSYGMAEDLSAVSTSHGEYSVGDLGGTMCKEVFIESAVESYEKYGENRRAVVVFAVTIEHGELLERAFRAKGLKVRLIHSHMAQGTRKEILREFDRGEAEFLINVGILTEGWDSPKVNLILMARPTLSPGLYVQMIGRGTRIYEGKTDLLVLDLVNNSEKHGMPWDPYIKERRNFYKICPACKTLLTERLSRKCSECGYEFPEPEAKPVMEKPLDDVNQSLMVDYNSYGQRVKVQSYEGYRYVSKAGNKMIKLVVYTSKGAVNEFLDIEGNGSEYGRKKALMWWRARDNYNPDPPRSCEEAIKRLPDLHIPENVTIRRENGYYKVVEWR